MTLNFNQLMNKDRSKLYWVIAGAILFNLLFWNEKLGINAALYGLFLLVVLLLLYPGARQTSTMRWLILGHLICLAMVVFHNSFISKFAASITLLLVMAFAQYVHRSVVFAVGSMFQNVLFVVPSFFESFDRSKTTSKSRKKPIGKWIRFAILPLLALILFFVIYSFANSVFLEIASNLWQSIANWFDSFFAFFSWSRFGFLLLGLLLTAFILLQSRYNYFARKEAAQSDELERIRKQQKAGSYGFFQEIVIGIMGKSGKGILALKNSNTIGLICLVLLNLLLLFVNVTDIYYVWFDFKPMEVSLYKTIHEGAGVLILSIVLAMLVLLIVFKGNLNFYKGNKFLKWAAYCWIIQNSILVISVFLRDYSYIKTAGLGRNRIGILFYLALVIVGLITVAYKIARHKTTYYLVRVNAWAAIVLLVLATTVNWDQVIVDYNLSRKDEIVMPVVYMVSLSDAVLPTLDKNREELKRHEQLMKKFGFWDYNNCANCWMQTLDNRIREYKQEQAAFSWLSWNYTDDSLRNYFSINEVKK